MFIQRTIKLKMFFIFNNIFESGININFYVVLKIIVNLMSDHGYSLYSQTWSLKIKFTSKREKKNCYLNEKSQLEPWQIQVKMGQNLYKFTFDDISHVF